MTTLKHAWFLFRGDQRVGKWNVLFMLVFTTLFMLYIGALSSMIIDDVIADGSGKVMGDFMLLVMVPLLGFTFSKRRVKYLSDDTYTRTLAYMRGLPIPAAVLLCKRKIDAIFAFVLNGTLFFGFMYALGPHLRGELKLAAFAAFALTWVGYGLVMAGIYILVEFSVSGKMYFIITLVLMIASSGVAALIWLAGGNVMNFTVECSQNWGLASPLMWGTLLAGTVSVQLFSKWTIHRLKSRDLV
ncbi:hypothetical protein [Paenibacillus tengchongensis]|uniref:hypothetical protein n=1 Tax=Paenibacillus tengchongensis TaxID=2608684 RepID=UPI00124D9081|nr:hypothetical protein [Paenibacillus tengchongensis]